VLGYVRVSTDEQARSGAGLAAQRQAVERACSQRGYDLLEIVEETNGVSAKSLEHPGIMRALEELGAGRADALMVAKLDRLSRVPA
jgi:site-specific DNA recombinase